MTASDDSAITSIAELEDLVGTPLPAVAAKARPVLHPIDLAWIERSPFCLVATSAADGTCDGSPKGDPPGFVQVFDANTLAVPERPGNRRVDGFRNVLSNPQVGLLFLVPGLADTLRVNGRARLVRDGPYFDAMAVRGRRPILVMDVEVEQVYFHCAKAFLRSQLWTARGPDDSPSCAAIARTLVFPKRPSPSWRTTTARRTPRRSTETPWSSSISGW